MTEAALFTFPDIQRVKFLLFLYLVTISGTGKLKMCYDDAQEARLWKIPLQFFLLITISVFVLLKASLNVKTSRT